MVPFDVGDHFWANFSILTFITLEVLSECDVTIT